MSRAIKEKVLPEIQAGYAERGLGEGRTLDGLFEDYDYERKYAIKLLTDKLP